MHVVSGIIHRGSEKSRFCSKYYFGHLFDLLIFTDLPGKGASHDYSTFADIASKLFLSEVTKTSNKPTYTQKGKRIDNLNVSNQIYYYHVKEI